MMKIWYGKDETIPIKYRNFTCAEIRTLIVDMFAAVQPQRGSHVINAVCWCLHGLTFSNTALFLNL